MHGKVCITMCCYRCDEEQAVVTCDTSLFCGTGGGCRNWQKSHRLAEGGQARHASLATLTGYC